MPRPLWYINSYLDMVQEVIVCLLFIMALAYVGRLLYSSFRPGKSSCAKGCGSCSALDVDKLEALASKARQSEKA